MKVVILKFNQTREGEDLSNISSMVTEETKVMEKYVENIERMQDLHDDIHHILHPRYKHFNERRNTVSET